MQDGGSRNELTGEKSLSQRLSKDETAARGTSSVLLNQLRFSVNVLCHTNHTRTDRRSVQPDSV